MIVVVETCAACLGFPSLYPLKNSPTLCLRPQGFRKWIIIFLFWRQKPAPLQLLHALQICVYSHFSAKRLTPTEQNCLYLAFSFLFLSIFVFKVLKNVRDKILDSFLVPIHCVDTGTVWLCFYIFATFGQSLNLSKGCKNVWMKTYALFCFCLEFSLPLIFFSQPFNHSHLFSPPPTFLYLFLCPLLLAPFLPHPLPLCLST